MITVAIIYLFIIKIIKNLFNEGIKNVFVVGNTIVEPFEEIDRNLEAI